MKYLLDTCIVSHFIRGHPNVVKTLLSHPPEEIALSTISRMEIEYGLDLQPSYEKKLRAPLEAFFATIYILPFELADSIAAAKIRASLKKKGQPIGAYDILLAGTSLSRNLTFVTANISEFQKIPGLVIEDWTQNNFR